MHGPSGLHMKLIRTLEQYWCSLDLSPLHMRVAVIYATLVYTCNESDIVVILGVVFGSLLATSMAV